jgi:O-antigen/teichoic acid export membrane protein
MNKQFLVSLTANMSRVVLGFVFFWQVTQALTLTSLGEYLYLISALGYFATLIDYGFNLFVLNTASRSQSTARPLFLRVILSKLVLTTVSLVILLTIYGFAFSEQGMTVTALFFIGLVLMSFSGLFIQFYKALGRFDFELSSTLLASALPVLLLFATGGEVTVVELGWILIVVRVTVLLFQMFLFLRLTPGQAWVDLHEVVDRLLPRALKDIRVNFDYAVFAVVGAVFLSVDLLIMRFLLGSEQVAIYGTANKVVVAAILFFQVLIGTFVPRLARVHETGNTVMFRREMNRFALVMVGGAMLFAAGLLVLGPFFVREIFGPELALSGLLLRFLSLALIFRVMAMLSGALLTIHGLQWSRARGMTIALVVHVAANFALQSWFGIWGAVYALNLSYFLLFALNSLQLLRLLRVEGAGE